MNPSWPAPSNPWAINNRRRAALASYGDLNAVFTPESTGGRPEFYPQHDQMYRNNMLALTPALPLKPPNPYGSPRQDPCLQNLMEEYEETHAHIANLMMLQGKTGRSKKAAQQSIERFTRKVQKMQDSSELTTNDLRQALAQTPDYFANMARLAQGIHEKNPFKPTRNIRYNGGTLACMKDPTNSEQQYLCYSSGTDLDNVTVSAIVPHDDVGIKTCSEATLELNTVTNSSWEDPMVYQVDAGVVEGEMLGVARQRNQCVLFSVKNEEEGNSDIIKPWISLEHQWSSSENEFTYAALNPFSVGEYAVVSDNCLNVISAKTSDILTTIPNLQTRFRCQELWHSVYWTRHDQIVCTDPTAMDLYDLRVPNQCARPLFEIQHRFLHPTERIRASKPLGPCHYHLVATDHSMILIDQRYPSHPAPLLLKHDLLKAPAYLYPVSTSDGLETVLLASQAQSELHAFQISLGDVTKPVQSKGLPFRASHPCDFAPSAARSVNEHKLNLPITGICGTAFPNDHLTVFQATSHGDVFAQSFTTTTSDLSGDSMFSYRAYNEALSLDKSEYNIARMWPQQCLKMINNAAEAESVEQSEDESGGDIPHTATHEHFLCPYRQIHNHCVNLAEDTDIKCHGCGLIHSEPSRTIISSNSLLTSSEDQQRPLLKLHCDRVDLSQDLYMEKSLNLVVNTSARLIGKLFNNDCDVLVELNERDDEDLKEKKAARRKNVKETKTEEEEEYEEEVERSYNSDSDSKFLKNEKSVEEHTEEASVASIASIALALKSTPRGAHSPTHGAHSPTHGTHSPTHGTHSPTHGTHSPTHGTHSPTHGAHSPTHGPRSPTLGARSPSQLIVSGTTSSHNIFKTPSRPQPESPKPSTFISGLTEAEIARNMAKKQSSAKKRRHSSKGSVSSFSSLCSGSRASFSTDTMGFATTPVRLRRTLTSPTSSIRSPSSHLSRSRKSGQKFSHPVSSSAPVTVQTKLEKGSDKTNQSLNELQKLLGSPKPLAKKKKRVQSVYVPGFD